MRSLWLVIAALAVLVAARDYDLSSMLLMEKLQSEYSIGTKSHLPTHGKCTQENIGVRKEWGAMCNEERTAYINALHCLRALPPKISHVLAPGARNRYDDFVVAHFNNTLLVHWSGYLLPWHRYLLYAFETALRDECGYSGYQPYWDWSKYAFKHWRQNPIIDGSAYSLSGNGKKIDHGPTNKTIPGGKPPRFVATLPPGLGGGCIEEGPLANFTVTIGPVYVTQTSSNYSSALQPNPHCIRRDFNPLVLRAFNSYKNVTDLILNHDTAQSLQKQIESLKGGVHAGGHTYIGGANTDLFVSPNDPLFFAHHAQLDRVWAIWQSRDFAKRTYQVGETITFLNYPPSRKFRLNDTLVLTEVFDIVEAKDVMSPTNGLLCYMYA